MELVTKRKKKSAWEHWQQPSWQMTALIMIKMRSFQHGMIVVEMVLREAPYKKLQTLKTVILKLIVRGRGWEQKQWELSCPTLKSLWILQSHLWSRIKFTARRKQGQQEGFFWTMKWWQKPPRRHLLNRLQSTICHYRPRRWCSVSTGTRKKFLHHHHHWQQWIKHFHQQHPFMSCQLNVSKSLKELEVQLNWGNQHCFQQMMQVTGFCTSSSTLSFLAISLRCWILQYLDLWAPEVYMGSMNPMMQGGTLWAKNPFQGITCCFWMYGSGVC